jgi:hypothetical protein
MDGAPMNRGHNDLPIFTIIKF